jgi:hypothetical protein
MIKALGCLAHLGLVGVLTMVIDRMTGAEVNPVLRPWVGLVAAVLLVLGASNFLQLLRGYGRGDAARGTLLARATTGEPPADGGPMLVTGRVRPDGPPLRAPLSGTECVAYDYRLYKRTWMGSRSGHRTTVYWGGYACQPFMVDTGARAVRVGAMPDFVDAPNRDKTDDTIGRARAYLQATRFEEIAGAEIVSLFGTMLGDRVGEAQAGVRRDWHRANASPDPATLRLEEHTVPVGATVSVAGYWLPERRALVPEPGGLGGSPVTIVTGGPEALLRRTTALPSSAISVAVFGVLLLALGAALVWVANAGYLARVN